MAAARYPVVPLVGVGIAAAFSVYGTYYFYDEQTERNKVQANAYQVGTEERRFAAVKNDLPKDGMVGYVSDLKDAGVLLATQYALVPSLIVERPPSGFVVANLSRPMDYAEFGRSRGLTLIKDYGYGVVLYRRAAP
jgi:hypothetical protein